MAPGLTAAEVADVNLILIGNAAPDHLHIPTLRRLPRGATLVVPPRCAGLVSELGFARVVELGIGQSLRHRGVDVASTPARNETGAGRPSCGYVLRGDGPSVFFCGDTGYFSGFSEIGRRWRPDIALLPIGGYVPRTFRKDHMSPLDALYAFDDLGARLMIPIRWGSFALSYETLAEPVAWLRELVAERGLEEFVTILTPGSSRKFEPPRDAPPEAPAPAAPAAPPTPDDEPPAAAD
jgi:L-ascorbate metabolism protein UlaG (beta-lactamase superfamily)